MPTGCHSLPGRVWETHAASCRPAQIAMLAARVPPPADATHAAAHASLWMLLVTVDSWAPGNRMCKLVGLTAELTGNSRRLRLLRQAAAGVAGGPCGGRPLKLGVLDCAGGPSKQWPVDMAAKTLSTVHATLSKRCSAHRTKCTPCCIASSCV